MSNILGWLINLLVGPIKAVVKWINKAFDLTFSFIDRVIHYIGNEILQAWRSAVNLAKRIGDYAVSVYHFAVWIVRVLIENLKNFFLNLYHDIANFAVGLYKFVVKWVDYIVSKIESVVTGIRSWVIHSIWDPLFNAISGAIDWITHEGASLWHLITHPDKLVSYLAKYLWGAWVGILKMFAVPIARWLLRAMLGLAGEFADVLETIISAIL